MFYIYFVNVGANANLSQADRSVRLGLNAQPGKR